MKKSAIPLLLAAIAIGQSLRLEAIPANEKPASDAADVSKQNLSGLSAERKSALAEAGLLPYRVAPPDVLLVQTTDENGDATSDATATIDTEYLIGPDGTINLVSKGKVRVHNMTVAEVAEAIRRKLAAKGVGVRVDVLSKNSRMFYVIVQGDKHGDRVFRMPRTPQSDIWKALTTTKFPADVDLQQATIWLSRPKTQERAELVRSVDWAKIKEDRKASHNIPLLPGDRIFVTMNGREATDLTRTANAPPPVPPSSYSSYYVNRPGSPAKIANVKVQMEVVRDSAGNLSEFEGLKTGPGMVINAKQMLATLKILRKNKIIDTLASPAITCRAGQTASITIDDIHVETVVLVQDDSQMRLETRVELQADKASDERQIHTAIQLKEGQTVVLRTHPARDDEAATTPNDYYVVFTPEILR